MGLPADMGLSWVAAEFELSLGLSFKLRFSFAESGLYKDTW